MNKAIQDMLGRFISVEQMNGINGPIKNQFIVRFENGTVFQSYFTIIAVKSEGQVFLDVESWDYSRTTGKYRNMFLGESKAETFRRIKNGLYKLVDLN